MAVEGIPDLQFAQVLHASYTWCETHAAGDWASFTTPRPQAGGAAPAWDAFTHTQTLPKGVQFTPPAPKPVREATPADLEAVAAGDALQLLETWQGSFTGPKLLKAGGSLHRA